jgi:hypothetical protein
MISREGVEKMLFWINSRNIPANERLSCVK